MRTLGIVLALMFIPPAFSYQVPSAYQESKAYYCPMHPEVQSSTEGRCPKCGMGLIVEAKKEQAATAGADAYTCPMHPEIRAGEPGKCPRCEMSLVPSDPEVPGMYDLRLETSPDPPRPGETVSLRFSIHNPASGKRETRFAMLHDRLLHLFLVSQDMVDFQHIHPRLKEDGTFVVEAVLRQRGHYKVYSDFYPVGGTPQVIQRNLVTAGHESDLFGSEPRLVPDESLVKVVEGHRVRPEEAGKLGVERTALSPAEVNPMRVELQIDPPEIIAGRTTELKYTLTDAKTGEPIRDLVPYLGAWGHTLILSEDQSDYVHSHPLELVPDTADRSNARGGPNVTFEAMLPRPATYRIWTQFLRADRLATVHFTVKAVRLH